MTSSKSRRHYLATAATLTLLASPTVASGQTVASAESNVSAAEIVVTARKRDERLIDIPVSIQAFTKESIAQAGIDNLQQISDRTPGLNFQNLGNSQPGRYNSTVRFRGMDVNISTPSNQTGAFLVDGVLVLGGAQSVGFGDIERIEVIKGPQAAYFGRGTFGGAVNLVTRDPSDDLSGQLAGEYSPNFDSYNLSAAIEGGLAPGISARVSASRVRKGAMFTANDGGALGAERTDMVNATVLLKPTETIRIKARATFGWDDEGAASAMVGRKLAAGSGIEVRRRVTGRMVDASGRLSIDPQGRDQRISLQPVSAVAAVVTVRSRDDSESYRIHHDLTGPQQRLRTAFGLDAGGSLRAVALFNERRQPLADKAARLAALRQRFRVVATLEALPDGTLVELVQGAVEPSR